MKKEKIDTINEALSVLDNALQEGSEEIKDIILADYQNLKKVLSGTAPQIKETLRTMKDRSLDAINQTRSSVKDFSQRTVKNIDHRAHQNPWTIIAGVTLTSMVVGYLAGRKAYK